MDDILTEFISHTKADAALAHDLLESTGWNLEEALTLYDSVMQTHDVKTEEWIEPSEFYHLGDETLSEAGAKDDIPPTFDDSVELRKLGGHSYRGFSFQAEEVFDKFHKAAISKCRVSSEEQTIIDDHFFRKSFVFPDFSKESADLQEFIASDLIDVSVKSNLEKNNRLNWWNHTGKYPRLEPLVTSGDGNCLLHAASLYMWGFHDRYLILRSSMYRLLTQNREKEGIFNRWRYQTQLRNNEAGGLTYSKEEWEYEWSEIVRIATNKPQNKVTAASPRRMSISRLRYEYLEEIHIFVLAHVTQRPIIVISDTTLKGMSGEDLAPIYFGGIYLPLEINPTFCHKSPVVLAYDAAHFCPLVARERKTQPSSNHPRNRLWHGQKQLGESFVPLVSRYGRLLPIQFVYNPSGPALDEKWGKMKYDPGEFPPDLVCLLESYISIRWIELPIVAEHAAPNSTASASAAKELSMLRFPAAVLAQNSQPVYQDELVDKYIMNVKCRFEEEKERRQKVVQDHARWKEARLLKTVPCKGQGCDMFGTAATNNLCSRCYLESTSGYDEVEKVDLASERKLDPETVEMYIPDISSNPLPSYSEALIDVNGDQGTQGGKKEEREGREEPVKKRELRFQTDGSISTASSDMAQKSPPKSPPETEDGSHSTDGIVSSSANGGNKSPKKPKGWAKKLQAFPSAMLSAKKLQAFPSAMLSGSKSKKAPARQNQTNQP